MVLGDKMSTNIEEQIIALVVDGRTNQEIADEVGYSIGYVKKTLQKAFEKWGVKNRQELVREYLKVAFGELV